MVEIKFVDVIGFKTEDPKFPTTNLLRNNKWLSEKKFGASVNDVTLRLEKVFTIGAIDIGNFGSAFICIEVSRIGLLRYETLLPSTSLMSAQDCKGKENWSCVKMFTTEDFNPDVCKQKWDLLRIICMQPFIKDVQFGLSFIKAFSHLNSVVEHVSLDVDSSNRLHIPRKSVTPLVVTSPLSRSEKLVEEVKKTCVKSSLSDDKQSGNTSSISTSLHRRTVVKGSVDSSYVSCVGKESSSEGLRANNPRRAAISAESSKCSSSNEDNAILSPKPRKRKLNMPCMSRCTQAKNVAKFPVTDVLEIDSDSDSDSVKNEVTKQEQVANIRSSPSLSSLEVTSRVGEGTSIKNTSHLKDDSDTDTVVIIPSSPDSISSQVTDIVENGCEEKPVISQKLECPICFETFEASKIEEHAACCVNSPEVMVCPICNNHFPPSVLQMHADLCAEKLSSSL